MATLCKDFVLATDPETVRSIVEEKLIARRFRLTRLDDQTEDAERGSPLGNDILGDFGPYMKVGIRLCALDSGTALRLERLSTGWRGQGVGGTRTKWNFRSLCKQLTATFENMGVLTSVLDAWDEPGRKTRY